MQSRPKNLWIGGDMIQLEKTSEALRKLGVEVDFNDQPLFTPAILLSDYDIVHTWNFSMPWTKYQIWAAARQGIPVVCSMIYHEGEQFIPYGHQQIMLDSLSKAIFLTSGEIDRVERHITLNRGISEIIPNGIDDDWFIPETGKEYVLTVGRLDGTKGQLITAMACKELGLKYICVGERQNEEYAKTVESFGAEILSPKDKEGLKPIYQKCSVYVLASDAEVMPLTVMEAGAMGKNIVLTKRCEWKIPAEYVDNTDLEEVKEAIRVSLKKSKNKEFVKMLKEMTWNKVAERLLVIYKELCQKC